MAVVVRSYVMSWGTPEHGAIQLPLPNLEAFRAAYDLVEADAQIVGGVFEVDLWDTALPLGGPTMLQFLVGHATRSRVLVHRDGLAHYAVGDRSEGVALRYVRPGGTFTTEAGTTTISPAQAGEIAGGLVRTGRVPEQATWAELAMD